MAILSVNRLRVGCWNSRGLSAAIPFLRCLLEMNDIFMISEHWLHNNCLSTLGDVSNDFNYHGRASKAAPEDMYGLRRGQGGVAIFWRKNLKGISVLETLRHDRICGIRMETGDGAVLNLLSVYLPACGSRENIEVTLDELSCIVENMDDNTVPIICGDFNGDMGKEGGNRGVRPPTKAGKAVARFMDKHNMIAVNLLDVASGDINTFESHNGQSTLDYIMIPEYMRGSVLSSHTGRGEEGNTSDHLPVEAELNIELLPRMVRVKEKAPRLKWNKVGMNEMMDLYELPLREGILTQCNDVLNEGENCDRKVDRCVDKLVEVMHQAALKIPRAKFCARLKPYWNRELSELKRDKMYWFSRWKEEGRSTDEGDHTRQMMKLSKKYFIKRLRALSREYRNGIIAEAANKAEMDRDGFWKLMRRMRAGEKSGVSAINNDRGKAVYEVNQILGVWQKHFDKISTPKHDEKYDQEHFQQVTDEVREWLGGDEGDRFLENPFSVEEVIRSIKKLNCNKAPGFDGITSEHLKYGGVSLADLLCRLYNMCREQEYIPCNFRRGVQVPLYKGKNTCPLTPDNYRGITLLSTFSKLFEVLVWGRIEDWWFREKVTSELQGAGRKNFSCVHTALTLHETIAKERESNKRVYVAYYDVSKAYDSVWIDGLFFQLHEMGIRGRLWRMLYKTYVNFKCCVRVGGEDSDWYQMDCGIHQGGYLSLVKYTAFINSLIVQLQNSELCSQIYNIKTSPVGYADDLATSTVSKNKMDRVMNVVSKHGNKWRYAFNAGKSAVLVFGESKQERKIGSENRMFKLGGKRVKERMYYEHVGIKTCVEGDTHIRTGEKVSKARKVLNMSTNMGVRRGGLNLKTCMVIYWSVVVPTLLFGCEDWFIKDKDVVLLQGFQRYAARRLQRLHYRSLNATALACLGWMDIFLFIKARKLIFIRTVIVMREFMPIRQILIKRLEEYGNNAVNTHESTMLQILSYCDEFGLLHVIRGMLEGQIISKGAWKQMVWNKAWEIEGENWVESVRENRHLDLISLTVEYPEYSIWWLIADGEQGFMKKCEIMIKLLCHASLLKYDDGRLRGAPFGSRCCTLCYNASYENARHMIMQCAFNEDKRTDMFNEIEAVYPNLEPAEAFRVLMGGHIEGCDPERMVQVWKIACKHIVHMYYGVLNSRRE